MRDDVTRQTAYGDARRHSFTVAVLKRALPITAVAIVGGFTFATINSGAFEDDAPATVGQIEQGDIVMANPRLDGMDRNERPYALTATAARQAVSSPAVVSLDTIDAKLPTDDGTFAQIDATAGTYDTKRETLVLSDGVQVRDLKGLNMDLEQARFDMDAGTMVSDLPVEVRSRNAEIDAQSMQVLESGKRILFSRRVRMVIHNGAAPANGKAAMLGSDATSTSPWMHTTKLSVDKFARPSVGGIRIKGTN